MSASIAADESAGTVAWVINGSGSLRSDMRLVASGSHRSYVPLGHAFGLILTVDLAGSPVN